jgi:hypothetical protein
MSIVRYTRRQARRSRSRPAASHPWRGLVVDPAAPVRHDLIT